MKNLKLKGLAAAIIIACFTTQVNAQSKMSATPDTAKASKMKADKMKADKMKKDKMAKSKMKMKKDSTSKM